MARASAADAARTAHAVLTTATTAFAAQGYTGVSLDDIARTAGVTRGAVYHHYANKAGLFAAVAEHLQAEVAVAVVAAAEQSGTAAPAQLRAGSHAFLDAITAAPAVRILLIDAPAVLGWAQWRAQDAAHSGSHLREALESAEVPPALLEATAVQLSGAMNEAALWLAQRPSDIAAHEAAHQVLDRLLDSIIG